MSAGSSLVRTTQAQTWLAVVTGLIVLATGCAQGTLPAPARSSRELVFAHDDNRGSSSFKFPNLTYESVVRFELPTGKHQPLRLRVMAETAGTIAITVYDNSLLECPGDEIQQITRELVADDLSNGKDGRWVVEDLRSLPALQGVVWIGMRKIGGEPSIWTSAVVSGQTYLRDRNPASAMGLLPVKRTPMVRLEILSDRGH